MSSAKFQDAGKSLNTLVLVMTVLLIFIMAARTPIEPDLGWHLRSGETTWETGKPLTSEVF